MPRREHVGQIAAVKPFAREHCRREASVNVASNNAQVAAPEAGDLGGAHFGEHRRHLARRELAIGFTLLRSS